MSKLGPLIALVAAAGIFFIYINPAWTGEIAAARAAIKNDDDALTAAASYARKEAELATERDQISSEDLARLGSLLPDSVNNVAIILDLNALASRSGVVLANINVANPAGAASGTALPAGGDGPVGSVDLSLSVTGTYKNFRAFLDGIERSTRILDIQHLRVRGSDTGVYSYDLTLRLYWLR